ncbi:MAG: ATP-binding protein [Bacteroidia bacterium]
MTDSSKKILLVEDNPDHIELIRRAFQKWEHSVEFYIAHNISEVTENMYHQNSDIAIIDWLLPDGTGKDLLNGYFAESSIPVIILTSQGNEQIAVSSLKQGAMDYIVKSESTLTNMPRIVERALREHQHIVEKQLAENALIEANRLLEQKVAERTYELQKSNESLEKFAHITSHDLKESLRMVSNYLQILKARLGDRLDEEETEFMKFAVDGTFRMHNLLDAIYRYSKIKTVENEMVPVDCNQLVQEVTIGLSARIEKHNASVSIGHLPTISGDPNQLFQLFQNLIGNAIKFNDKRPPVVEVGVEETNSDWTFFVNDNGIGIDPRYVDTIFEMFKRLHSQDKYTGDGVGLAICQQIVDRHKGKIWAESQPGLGTTFFFTLPKG